MVSTPSKFNPFPIKAKVKIPSNPRQIDPEPPKTETPPTTGAAIAVNAIVSEYAFVAPDPYLPA